MSLSRAALLLPGDSVLRGETEISQHLKPIFRCLNGENVQVKKVSLVEESLESIFNELQLLSKLFDVVIILSSRVTESVVRDALGQALSQEPSKTVKSSNLLWPASVKVIENVIYIQGIFVFFWDSYEEQLPQFTNRLRHYNSGTRFTKVFSVNLNGFSRYLDEIKGKSSISVHLEANTLTLQADTLEDVVQGELGLKNLSKGDFLTSNWVNQSSDLIYQSSEAHIRNSIEVIEKCLKNYGVDNVFLSFNGGKDCTVLLHLVLTVIGKNYPKHKGKLFCLYVKSENAFKEQDEFIEQCMVFFNLQVMSVTGNIKDALRVTINQKPNLKACFMGTRRTDPYCFHLNSFQVTDPDWPSIMRCSPFLDWHYTDIWDYLLYYKVPYCKLYDYGYTSLGNAVNTVRNPNLRFCEGEKEVFLPAYKMLDEKSERKGRNVSQI